MSESIELKQQVISMAENMPVQMIVNLLNGIVSPATIYRWISASKQPEEVLSIHYTVQQLQREQELYRVAKGSYEATPRSNKIVLNFQPHFYHREQQLWQRIDIREKLLANRQKYLKKDVFTNAELLRGFKISGIYNGYSHFSPLWLRKFIEQYKVKSIYDPCGGWGHRIIGAMNIDYHYNDVWDLSCIGAEKIIKFCNTSHVVTNNDATKISTTSDVCFTCPPYFNIEQYNKGKFRDMDDYQEFLSNMIDRNEANLWGIVINNTCLHAVQTAFNSTNYMLKQIIKIGKSFSHFTNKTKQNAEWLLIYAK